jgi:hypothetical protein
MRQTRMPFGSVCQAKLGFGRIPVMDRMAGGRMMADDVVTCLGVGMHGGGQKDDRSNRQNMSHFTLHLMSEEWSQRSRSAFERAD